MSARDTSGSAPQHNHPHNNTMSRNEKFWVDQVTVPPPPGNDKGWGTTGGGGGTRKGKIVQASTLAKPLVHWLGNGKQGEKQFTNLPNFNQKIAVHASQTEPLYPNSTSKCLLVCKVQGWCGVGGLLNDACQ